MLTFTEDCFTGVNAIDEKRKKIYDIVLTEYEGGGKAGGKERLRFLIKQLEVISSDWFSEEEAYIAGILPTEKELQVREHKEFSAKLIGWREEAKRADGDKDCDGLYGEMMKFLIRWFFRHIVCRDTMIKGMVERVKKEEKRSDKDKVGEGQPSGTDKSKGRPRFTEKYMIGIPHIDEEHKMLFSIIGEAFALMNDEFLYDKYDRIKHILDELIAYTKTHFKDEEEYMESINYTGLEEQKKAHGKFVDKLESLDLESLEENQDEYLNDLLDFLLNWLVNHILKVDKKIPVM